MEEHNHDHHKNLVNENNLEMELLSLQVIGDYSNEGTPFDQFDTDCH